MTISPMFVSSFILVGSDVIFVYANIDIATIKTIPITIKSFLFGDSFLLKSFSAESIAVSA